MVEYFKIELDLVIQNLANQATDLGFPQLKKEAEKLITILTKEKQKNLADEITKKKANLVIPKN